MLLHLATELQTVDLELEVVVLLQIMSHRLCLHQVMGLLLVHLEVVLLHLATQLQAADSEVEVVVLPQVMVHRLHLHQVMGLPQTVLEVRAFLLQVTQLLVVDSVEAFLLRVTLLPQFLLTMFLLLLHRVTGLHQHRLPHMELPQYHLAYIAVPEVETLEHRLPAMGHHQHRQTDHRRRPERMVPPNRRPLRLPITELPQYLRQAMDLLAFTLDRSVPEGFQVRHNHQEVTRLLQHLRQVTARLLLPVHMLEDFLHKQTRALAPLERSEVALRHRVTERRPDHQATMVLRVEVLSVMAVLLPVIMVLPVLLVHRLRTTVHQQGQLLRDHLHPTEHPVLHLDHTQLQVRTTALLLYLLEITAPQHVDRQGHQDILTLPINSLKEVRRQGVTLRPQLLRRTTQVTEVMCINFVRAGFQ